MKAILNGQETEINDEQILRYAFVRKAMSDFQSANPEYDPIQSNTDKLLELIETRGQDITVETLQSAFYALRSDLQLRRLAIREVDFKGPSVEQQRAAKAAEEARIELRESTHCAIYEDSAGREIWLPLFHRFLDGRDTGQTAVKDDVSALSFVRTEPRENRPIQLQRAGNMSGFYRNGAWVETGNQQHFRNGLRYRESHGKTTGTKPTFTREEVERWSSDEMKAQIAAGNEPAINAARAQPRSKKPVGEKSAPGSARPDTTSIPRGKSFRNAAIAGSGSYNDYQK